MLPAFGGPHDGAPEPGTGVIAALTPCCMAAQTMTSGVAVRIGERDVRHTLTAVATLSVAAAARSETLVFGAAVSSYSSASPPRASVLRI